MKKYMIMECHLSYAVALDEDGRFLKVANIHYEPGQTVTDVVEMQVPQSAPRKRKAGKYLYSLAAMAACLALVLVSVFQLQNRPYASVYMSINPQLRIDVNRNDTVVGLDGINADGGELIKDYDHRKKSLDLVMDELVDRAIDMGYLHEGGKVSLVLDAESDEWLISHSESLSSHLNEHLNEKMSVSIEVRDIKEQSVQVIIPVAPGDTVYDDSDYGPAAAETAAPSDEDAADSDYGDSSYGEGRTDYGTDDGGSDYSSSTDYDGEQRHSDGEDAQSDYDDPSSAAASDYDAGDAASDYDAGDAASDYDAGDAASDYGAGDAVSDYGAGDAVSDYGAGDAASDYDAGDAASDYDSDDD